MTYLKRFFQKIFKKKEVLGIRQSEHKNLPVTVKRIPDFHSKQLDRTVLIDIFLPPSYYSSSKNYPCLYLNDGQDMEAVELVYTLSSLFNSNRIGEIIVIAPHANADRMQEYGTASQADYKQRGSKAKKYTQFLVSELIPYVHKNYRSIHEEQSSVIAGFSLGGLSALDIAWQHPDIFGKVGVFSGALWWRSTEFDENNPDANRIMHTIIKEDECKDNLQFWFQTGTKDEEGDRNNNGIIDAIDDTLDLIKELKKLGYSDDDIKYVEVPNGQHNTKTWGAIMPDFLVWAFSQINSSNNSSSQ